MTSRELLERCAKVMGFKETAPIQDGYGFIALKVMDSDGDWVNAEWNPLTSVADAADMAIKTKVDVGWHHSEVWATQNGKGIAVPFKDHPTEQAAYCYAVCQVVAQMGGE